MNDFLMSKVGKQDLINRGKVNRKKKLAPVFDANLYESHVERRKRKHEVYMKETGKFPYSFYLVNQVLYVGNHLAKGKQFSTKSLADNKPSKRLKLTKKDTLDQRRIYQMTKSQSAKQLLEDERAKPMTADEKGALDSLVKTS